MPRSSKTNSNSPKLAPENANTRISSKPQIKAYLLAEQIARTFSALLAKAIGQRRLARVIRKNKQETDPHICHSHDYIDANMVMDAAFKKHLGRCAHFITAKATEAQKNADYDLWNQSWILARQHAFYTAEAQDASPTPPAHSPA